MSFCRMQLALLFLMPLQPTQVLPLPFFPTSFTSHCTTQITQLQQLTQVQEINKIKAAEWRRLGQTRAVLALTLTALAGGSMGVLCASSEVRTWKNIRWCEVRGAFQHRRKQGGIVLT